MIQKLNGKRKILKKITYSIVRVCSCGGRRNGDREEDELEMEGVAGGDWRVSELRYVTSVVAGEKKKHAFQFFTKRSFNTFGSIAT